MDSTEGTRCMFRESMQSLCLTPEMFDVRTAFSASFCKRTVLGGL